MEHLLFAIIDQLAVANWQRTGKKTGRPKPVSPAAAKPKRIGRTDHLTPEQVDELLRQRGPEGNGSEVEL